MEFKIELPKGIDTNLSYSSLENICNKFNCVLEGKTAQGTWIVSTENAINLFLLGGNLSLRLRHLGVIDCSPEKSVVAQPTTEKY